MKAVNHLQWQDDKIKNFRTVYEEDINDDLKDSLDFRWIATWSVGHDEDVDTLTVL